MRIAVVGAGAIGSFFAASLDHARHRVIVAARGKRLEFLRNHPLQVVSCGQIFRHHVEVAAPDDLAGPIDLAICCVKTPDFATALTALVGKLAPDGVVLTVQNGVEAHEIAEDFLPGTMVVAGRFHGFFEMDGDEVRHTGVPPSLVFGCTRGKPEAAHDVVLTALGGSGFNTEASPDISRALWEKFMLAASLGGVATALEVPAGQVCTEPHGDELLRAAMEEVAALARCAGIALPRIATLIRQRAQDFLGDLAVFRNGAVRLQDRQDRLKWIAVDLCHAFDFLGPSRAVRVHRITGIPSGGHT